MPSASTQAVNGISKVPPIWSSAACTSAASSGDASAIAVCGSMVPSYDRDGDAVDRVGPALHHARRRRP